MFNYKGVLTFNDEEELSVTVAWHVDAAHTFALLHVAGPEVMDYDKFTSDDLCGTCTLVVNDLQHGGSCYDTGS